MSTCVNSGHQALFFPLLAAPGTRLPFTLLTVMADMVQTRGCLLPQKLLQNIQLKEQQKLLEQQLAVHLGQNPELLAQALKGVIPVSHCLRTTTPL